jgi:raffinose/stachyose/melibiose transport system permease protein
MDNSINYYVREGDDLKKSFKATNIMYIPALLLLFIFIVVPFINGFRISFTNWNGYSQKINYVGFENFKYMLSDINVWIAFRNTMIYGIGSTIFQQIIGITYAVFLNKEFRGRTLTRTIVYLPVLISAIIMGYMWYFLLRYDGGALNDVLEVIGMSPKKWLWIRS